MPNPPLQAAALHIRRLAAAHRIKEQTDGHLLRAFLADNDQLAFTELMRRHGPMVLAVCRRVLHHAQDAEDAFQATFLLLARQARSIRRTESLAGWLHGVASRMATNARRAASRRRKYEDQAPSTPPPNPAWSAAWREVQAILDEEIDRLPQTYRQAFVLCCLENRSCAEAARQLGQKEGTVWSRVSRARKLLQERLAKRGVSLAAVLGAAALSGNTALSATPPALIATTVKAAALLAAHGLASGLVSPGVAVLMAGAKNAMALPKLKTVILLLLTTLAVGVAGAARLAQRKAATPSAAAGPQAVPPPARAQEPQPARPGTPTTRAAPSLVEKGDTVTVCGRVLDPDGKPFAGAEITLWWHLGYWGFYKAWHPRTNTPFKPRYGATSDKDGRFRFTFAKSEVDENPLAIFEGSRLSTQVVAAAKGYGPAWAVREGATPAELTLQLAKADVPLKGRVIDFQGRPVAAATVSVEWVARDGEQEIRRLWQNSWRGLPQGVVTSRDGRFTLPGVGRERTALLHVEGPTIEHKMVSVRTRTAPGDATVEIVAGPTKPIVGTIRAKDTGKPLAGVVVYGREEDYHRRVRAVTDDQGRYRLIGLPKTGDYELTVYPEVRQGYLGTQKRVADSDDLKPLTADFELRRGVPVHCRFIDKETRQPVRGDLHYTPLAPNPFYREASDGIVPTREFRRVHVPNGKGVFHLVAYPGLGLLTLLPQDQRFNYLPVAVAPADAKKAQGDPHLAMVNLYRGYRLIDPADTDQPLSFDIELDPGRKVTGTLRGPDSRPVAGATAYGLHYNAEDQKWHTGAAAEDTQPLAADAFTASRLEVGTPRTVSFLHKDLKAIGHVVLRGDEKGPVTVRLERWATLSGRLLDTRGKPLRDVRVRLHYPPLPEPGIRPPDHDFLSDGEGRFQVEGLVSGLKHELTLTTDQKGVSLSAGDALKGLSARAGEVMDLGDVRVQVVPAKGGEAPDEHPGQGG
jgi:RNA polymerase sigma factor (sigma-70 family)